MILRDRVIAFAPSDNLDDVLTQIGTTSHTGFPVLENERLTGMITINDVQNVKREPGLCPDVGRHMTRSLQIIYPDNSLEDALALMVTHNINHLPVVSREDSGILLGLLSRTDILRTYARLSACVPKEGNAEPVQK